MEQDENTVVDSAETTTQEDNEQSYEQDDSDSEVESETGEETIEQRQTETPEQRSARIKRQVEREAKKQGKTVEEYLGIQSKKVTKESNKEVESPDVVMDRLDRSDLRAEGFKDKAEQDLLIKYSRFENMDVVDFASTTLGKTLIKEHRAKNATPSPARRTGTGTRDEVAYWADQMSKGNRPPTAELRTKARAYLAQNKK